MKIKKCLKNMAVEYNGERTLEGISKFIETDGEYGRAAPDEVVDYDGERTLEGLKNFIDSGGKKAKEPEEEPKETDSKKDEL